MLDSVGIGEMPDAAAYGDAGSDTLGNIARRAHVASCRIWRSSGLGNLKPLAHVGPVGSAHRGLRKLRAGVARQGHHHRPLGNGRAFISPSRFPLFPHGFPPEIMDEFERRIGRGTLGNYAASGTEIIKELGEEHMRTG